MSLKQKSLKALSWDLIGRFANQGITFVTSIFLSRLLLPEDFGLVAMINVVIVISNTFIDAGLGSALIQRKDVTNEHYASVFFFNVFMGLIMALLLFSFSGLIARFYERSIIEDIGRVLSLIFIISSFGNSLRARLQRELSFKILTYANWAAAIFGGAIGITMALQGYGVWSLVTQALIAPLAANICLFLLVKWRPKLKFSFSSLKELWGFGMHMFFTGVIQNIFAQLDSLIIGKVFAPAQLGYYYRAKSLQNVVYSYSTSSLISVLFPSLSSIQNDNEYYKHTFFKIYNVINFVSFYLLGVLYLTAEDIIILLFGVKWMPSVLMFKIMILGSFIYPLAAIFITVLSSRGKSKKYLQLDILKRVVLVPVFLIAFYFDIEIFLYALIVAGLINMLINIHYVSKELNIAKLSFVTPLVPYFLMVITLILFLNYIIIIQNLIVHAILTVSLYTCMYMFIAYVFKLEGYKLSKKELFQILKKK